MAQVIEYLPGKSEALSSNPSTVEKKKSRKASTPQEATMGKAGKMPSQLKEGWGRKEGRARSLAAGNLGRGCNGCPGLLGKKREGWGLGEREVLE
jgi:hypothetical protein